MCLFWQFVVFIESNFNKMDIIEFLEMWIYINNSFNNIVYIIFFILFVIELWEPLALSSTARCQLK